MSVTEGKGARRGQPQTIATGEPIPNVAIFLKRSLLEFLQVLFSQRAKGSFHYDPDDTVTEIQICDVHAVDLEAVNLRPAIVAVRGPVSFVDVGGLGGSAVEAVNMKTGKTTFNSMLAGSVAFSCVAREGIVAEQLGHLVFNSLKYFRPVLQRYGYFTVKSVNIGGEGLIETVGADDKTYVVPVFVTAQVQDRWTLTDTAARKLEKVIVETLVNIKA